MRAGIMALIAALAGGPALGQQRYTCDFAPEPDLRAIVPKRVTVEVASGTMQATVADPISQFWIGKPITARIESETDSQIRLWWGIATGGHQGAARGRQSYALSIDKASLAAELRVSMANPQRTHDARGNCRPDPAP